MTTTTRAIDCNEPRSGPPLLTCPHFSTNDPDEAVHETAKVIAPHQMDVSGDLSKFQAFVRWAPVGDASLCYLNYRSPLKFYLAQRRPIVSIVLPISGDMAVSVDQADELDVPLGSCAVIPASHCFELLYRTPFSVFVMYVQTSALRNGLRRIAPEVDDDGLLFDPRIVTESRRAGVFYGLAGLLVDVVDQYSEPSMMPVNVTHALSDQIISTYLLGLAHNRSSQMLRSARPVSSRVVRLAVDAVQSDTYAQKTVTDIAEAVGVSLRSLELGFRKEFGCTPLEYIRKIRLQRAHDQLRLARPGDGITVTDVAIRWGFNHASRFAALYRQTYGVAPSDTLRGS